MRYQADLVQWENDGVTYRMSGVQIPQSVPLRSSQAVKARDSDPRIPRFESLLLSQPNIVKWISQQSSKLLVLGSNPSVGAMVSEPDG